MKRALAALLVLLATASNSAGVVNATKHPEPCDALGRETKSILLESLSQGGSRLNTMTRTYVDAPDTAGRWRVNETDAAGSTTSRFTDALGRVVTVEDARHFQTQLRYDAKAQRRTRDAKGYVTEADTDAVYRPTAVREFDVGASTETYSRCPYRKPRTRLGDQPGVAKVGHRSHNEQRMSEGAEYDAVGVRDDSHADDESEHARIARRTHVD